MGTELKSKPLLEHLEQGDKTRQLLCLPWPRQQLAARTGGGGRMTVQAVGKLGLRLRGYHRGYQTP